MVEGITRNNYICVITLNLDHRLRRCRYRHILSRALAAHLFSGVEPLCNFGRGYHKEQFCEIILNLHQLFRRCRLNDLLSRALVVLVFSGAEPFNQFW